MQSQDNADNTVESSIVTNPMVIGNNSNESSFYSGTINKDCDIFLSELIINKNQSFVSDQLRKDNTVTADVKQTSKIHTSDSEGFISDNYKDPDIEAQTIQKKKESRRKRKRSQKLIFQGPKAVTKGSKMMN